MSDALLKTLAAWIPLNAIMLGVSMRNEWSPVIPQVLSLSSLVGFLLIFGKVPDWHNMIESEPPVQPEPEPEPEDRREFAGWSLEAVNRTRNSIQMRMVEEWYTPPCPIDQAMSYALALVNNHFEWFDERHLKDHMANISGGNYRALRGDWLKRKWCAEYGKKTLVTDKRMILKIAFDKPE
jgi:hypothetical protein